MRFAWGTKDGVLCSWLKPTKEVVFVNLTTLPIGPAELKTAFAVSENVLWWRALLQTLAVRQQEAMEAAATAPTEIAMAREVGKAQVLSDVIADLQKLRKMSVSE